jgi:hypothetical protein
MSASGRELRRRSTVGLRHHLGMSRTVPGPDGLPRCGWCAAGSPDYVAYHDPSGAYPSLVTLDCPSRSALKDSSGD